MPGTYAPRHDEMRHVDWVALFADRDETRTRINAFFRAVDDPFSKPTPPVLQFYGVSGQGKTALFRKIQEDCAARYRRTRFAFVELEVLEATRVTQTVEVLWHITEALAAGGIMAPLTLCLYAHYWRKQNSGQEFRLEGTPLKEYLEDCIRGCAVLSPFQDVLHEFSDVGQAGFKLIAILDKFLAHAVDRSRELRIADLRGAQPGEWDFERIERSFPEFLALDLLAHLKANGDESVCLVVDTFERIEPAGGRDACERAFQDLCGRLIDAHDMDENGQPTPSAALRGRTGVLLFGREQIRWERYNQPGSMEPWEKFIEVHELVGFAQADAQAFLRNEYRIFWGKRAPEVVPRLQEYETAILAASREQTDPTTAPTYLPYYLRLAGEMIYELGKGFVPEMLGHSPDEMQDRFVKYLRESSKEKLRAIQILAMSLYFDDELFDCLVCEHHVVGIPVGAMVPMLLANRSYVRRVDMGGTASFQFHRHLQQALLDDLGKSPEEIATAEKAIDAILEFYARRAVFDDTVVFEPARHLSAYEHGASVLLSHAERGWIPIDKVTFWLRRFEAPFDDDDSLAAGTRIEVFERAWRLASKVSNTNCGAAIFLLSRLGALYLAQGRYREAQSFLEQAQQHAEEGMGDDLLALYIYGLGHSYQAQGRYEEAEVVYKRDLAVFELGPGSGVAFGLGCLAGLYAEQGRYEEAESHYCRALEIVEKSSLPEDLCVAAIRSELSTLYSLKGQYEKAESLLIQALRVMERTRAGTDRVVVGNNLNNLAEIYRLQSRYEEAEPLYQRALTIREESLGIQHPAVAQTLTNLARLHLVKGQYAEAEATCRRGLDIRIQALGEAHPATATSISTLAQIYAAQDRDAEAYHLFSRAASVYIDVLGYKHPDVGAMLNGLALLHAKHGEYEEAEKLYRTALAITTESLGTDHPKVVAVLQNYSRLLKKAPDLEARLRKEASEQARVQDLPRSRGSDTFPDPQRLDEGITTLSPFSTRRTVGRNQPCPCGSGRKYKKCCGA